VGRGSGTFAEREPGSLAIPFENTLSDEGLRLIAECMDRIAVNKAGK